MDANGPPKAETKWSNPIYLHQGSAGVRDLRLTQPLPEPHAVERDLDQIHHNGTKTLVFSTRH